MKKTTMMIVATALVMALPIITLAQDNNRPIPNDTSTTAKTNFWKDNFSVTAGLKIWYATLTLDFLDEKPKKTAPMYGPAVNVTFKEKFYVGMSYYTGNNFKYTIKDDNDDFELKIKKSDFDIWTGYNFHPRGSVLIGYKTSNIDTNNNIDGDVYDIDLKGPVIGVSGNYPISDSGFVLFGTIGYAFLDVTFKGHIEDYNKETRSGSGSGPALEFGAVYIFRNLPQLSLTAGLKYQNYDVSGKDISSNGNLYTLSGFTFGANYRF
jgi:hypothetical protein